MVGIHMTELERARAHLLSTQRDLRRCREAQFNRPITESYERYVIAALSWVWEEQEKDRLARYDIHSFIYTHTSKTTEFSLT